VSASMVPLSAHLM